MLLRTSVLTTSLAAWPIVHQLVPFLSVAVEIMSAQMGMQNVFHVPGIYQHRTHVERDHQICGSEPPRLFLMILHQPRLVITFSSPSIAGGWEVKSIRLHLVGFWKMQVQQCDARDIGFRILPIPYRGSCGINPKHADQIYSGSIRSGLRKRFNLWDHERHENHGEICKRRCSNSSFFGHLQLFRVNAYSSPAEVTPH